MYCVELSTLGRGRSRSSYWSCGDWLRFVVSGMEVDSPSQPQDLILKKLHRCGIGVEHLVGLHSGLVEYVKANRRRNLPKIVAAILPSDHDLKNSTTVDEDDDDGDGDGDGSAIELFRESILWLKWLMFENDPKASLEFLSLSNVDHRGVCGAVWGQNDIAYRCRTCEHDPTCAICVSCFQNGNHKDHDYSLMYTGGGCCDCGDITAWKRDGFCSKHKGPELIQPLPLDTAASVGPVLDDILIYWRDKLLFAQASNNTHPNHHHHCIQLSNDLTVSVVEMLLEFCKYSESLLAFVSTSLFSTPGLLDVLVMAERFLTKNVVVMLHELLLKLLGEPTFKYEFAKVFIKHYPSIIKEAIKLSSDNILEEKYPLLSTFSVQIFTVPTLTLRLVKEMNLLDILLGCIMDIFYSCQGEEGHIQVGKWASLYETTVRLVEDIRYVMSHAEVPKHVTREHPDIYRKWIQLLTFVQGVNPQKRVTGLHVEEESEHTHMPFVLGHSIANIHSLFVTGAFSGGLEDYGDGLDHAKVGKFSQEGSVCSTRGRGNAYGELQGDDVKFESEDYFPVPSLVLWLTFECLRAIENWLGFNALTVDPHNLLPQDTCWDGSNFSALKKTISRIGKGKNTSKAYWSPFVRTRLNTPSGPCSTPLLLPSHRGFDMCIDMETAQSGNEAPDTSLVGAAEMDVEYANGSSSYDDNCLETVSGAESESLGILSLSDWPDIPYNISSQDISVHIPLHRLLAMLLQKMLTRCYGGSKALDACNSVSDSPSSTYCHDFFGWILRGCHPVGFSAFLMEHPLRIRVFCAQVRAGMWRKNGDAAMLSCDWYRSVRWSEQGLELDLFLLQCCAALAPPDLYVGRILDRFGLSSYLSLSPERSNEYEPILVQEMLSLLIQIVKERRFCGHSTIETLRRELIYKLAIGDATRSQLLKSLPHDLSKNDQLQSILDTVAVYANPSAMKQGKYSLRKAYWEELDLYHPRWNSRELQVAEERYLRFCKVSASSVQLPRWTSVFGPLNGISRIAVCRRVLEIVRAVLFYAVCTDKAALSRAPDGVLVTALHLLSLALDICLVQRKCSEHVCSTSQITEDILTVVAFACEEFDTGSRSRSDTQKPHSLLSLLVSLMVRYRSEFANNFSEGQSDLYSMIGNLFKRFAELDLGCMNKLKTLLPELVGHLLPSVTNGDMHTSGSASNDQDRRTRARERQAAILEKMRAAQSKFMASMEATSNEDVDGSTSRQGDLSDEEFPSEEPLVCSLCRDPLSRSPLSFMVLLQKSRLASFAERHPPSWEQVYTLDKEHKSKTKEEAAVDNNHNDTVSGEVDAFLDFIKARVSAARHVQLPSTSHDESMDNLSIEILEDNIYHSIQQDLQDILVHQNASKDFLVDRVPPRENNSNESRDTESLLFEAYFTYMSREKSEHPPASKIARNENASSNIRARFTSFDGFGPTNCDGIHISSCGHAVHQECRDRYLASLRERYSRRIVFEGGHVVDPDQGEFLCPVCRRFANSVLPTFKWSNFKKARKQMMLSDLSAIVGTGLSTTSEDHVVRFAKALSLLRVTARRVGKGRVLQGLLSARNEKMQPSLEALFHRLCRMYFPDRCDKLLESGRVSHSILLWDTLRYSLISTEIAARGRSILSPDGSVSAVGALYRELESSSGFILSLLLQNFQSTRSENCLQMLLRFRGIHLFKESICSGVSIERSSSVRGSQEGNHLSSLKQAEKETTNPDFQFWKRAADPVLAHDAFSSLMWILFSLPRQFLSSTESFLSLVHLLYVVCVIQALVTCCGHQAFDADQLGSGHSLVAEICKMKSDFVAAQQHFVSHYIDSSCHPTDMMRLLSHSYLRRCALLWKLLKSSMPAPFGGRSSTMSSDLFESTTGHSMELKEVEELENMFQIPDLNDLLNNKEVHAIGLRWLHHFCEEFEVRKYGRELHSYPAVPFRLLHLPPIYQDLLERYIKQKCPECMATLPDPALCLLCGRLCSPSWKACCRESGCHSHAMSCGAGIGVFLLIRKTTILLQRSARHAPWPSPYLDAFGEEDIDMHRGKPLYLNKERYAALTHMVACHGLDQSSEVLRQTTIDSLFLI